MIWGAAKILRSKGGMMLRGSSSRLEVLERRQLGKTSSVALVRIDDQTLVLGVGDNRVEVLLELPAVERDEVSVSAVADVVDISSLTPNGHHKSAGNGADLGGTTQGVVVSAGRPSFVEALRELTVRRPSTSTRTR